MRVESERARRAELAAPRATRRPPPPSSSASVRSTTSDRRRRPRVGEPRPQRGVVRDQLDLVAGRRQRSLHARAEQQVGGEHEHARARRVAARHSLLRPQAAELLARGLRAAPHLRDLARARCASRARRARPRCRPRRAAAARRARSAPRRRGRSGGRRAAASASRGGSRAARCTSPGTAPLRRSATRRRSACRARGRSSPRAASRRSAGRLSARAIGAKPSAAILESMARTSHETSAPPGRARSTARSRGLRPARPLRARQARAERARTRSSSSTARSPTSCATLRPGDGRYAAFLTHKGKMLGDLRILAVGRADGDAPTSCCSTPSASALQALFDMIRRFKVGYDVELHKRTLERGLLSLIGPEPRGRRRRPRRGARSSPSAEHANRPASIAGVPALAVRTRRRRRSALRRARRPQARRAALLRARRGADRRAGGRVRCASSAGARATASTSTTA